MDGIKYNSTVSIEETRGEPEYKVTVEHTIRVNRHVKNVAWNETLNDVTKIVMISAYLNLPVQAARKVLVQVKENDNE